MACSTNLVRCIMLTVAVVTLNVNTISTSDIGDKPGTCPQDVMVPSISSSIIGGGLGRRSVSPDPCENLCLNDFDCPGVEKCCDAYCGKVCLTPKVEKPGTCPLTTSIPPSLDISGQSFRPYTSVSGNARPYNTIVGGGHSGPFSVGGRLPGKSGSSKDGGRPRPSGPYRPGGRHPAFISTIVGGGLNRRSRSADPCGDLCLNDFDCDGDMKCCTGSCGRICVGPQEKPGTCPQVPSIARGSIVGGGLNRRSTSTDHCGDLCLNDFDCDGVKKCCSGSCGRVCMNPGGEKPGACPAIAYSSIVGGGIGKRSSSRSSCEDSCMTDFDCETEKKCCDGYCGKICVYPQAPST